MSILRYEEVEWALPFLFGYDVELMMYVAVLKEMGLPYKFNSFGATKCKWSGGRKSLVQTQDAALVERLFSHLVNIGVKPSLTFTNRSVSKEDLNDPFCNKVLDIACDLDCNLITSSDLLFEYIKDKYPSSYCTASVIKPIFEFQDPVKQASYDVEAEIDYYNELLKKYDKVVVRPEFAKYYLNDCYKKIDDISRIEVLLNQVCVPNCPKAVQHYTYIEREEADRYESREKFECYSMSLSSPERQVKNLCFSIEETDNMVNNIGLKHLKLQGRAGAQGPILPFLAFYSYVFKDCNDMIPFQISAEYKNKAMLEIFKTKIA